MSIKQAIEALEELVEYAETAGFDWSLDNARAAIAALRSMPAGNNDVDLLLRAVFELCEATEEAPEVAPRNEHQRGFDKGRRFEAKAIRRAVGDWFQATFCGRSFMGEPVLAVAPKKPVPFNEKRCTSCGGSLPITGRLDQTGECECTTPPPAPVLSDAEIDAITVAQWGDRVVTAAYRAYARAIEQAIGRASRGAK